MTLLISCDSSDGQDYNAAVWVELKRGIVYIHKIEVWEND